MLTNFTSESVAAGHPDKICDQISDAIVDAALAIDPFSRVAVETLVTKNRVVMAGEVTCPNNLPYKKIARDVIKSLGYTKPEYNFWYHSPIDVHIHSQSPDISQGVDIGGAGDQGMMIGFATNETKEYMPLPLSLSHKLVMAMDQARETKKLPFLRPDGKSAVNVEYKKQKPNKITQVILAVPHNPQISNQELNQTLYQQVVLPVLDKYGFSIDSKNLIVNGTGRWEIGGPATDTGVTGRKIIVDTYGSIAPHGGGAFSGKDPTKVDRSGAYATRFLSKNIVAHDLADKAEVRVAYVIGQAEPISVNIDTFGTNKTKKSTIKDFASKLLNLRVQEILKKLKLRRPIYRETARYGHLGKPGFSWEKVVSSA